MNPTTNGYLEEKYHLSPRQANEIYIALRMATNRGELVQYDYKGEEAHFHYPGAWKEWHGESEAQCGRKFVISIKHPLRGAQNEAIGYTVRVLFVPTLVNDKTWDEKAMQIANDSLLNTRPSQHTE